MLYWIDEEFEQMSLWDAFVSVGERIRQDIKTTKGVTPLDGLHRLQKLFPYETAYSVQVHHMIKWRNGPLCGIPPGEQMVNTTVIHERSWSRE